MRIQMKYRKAPSRVKAASKASMAYADIAQTSRVFIAGSPARDVVGEIELQNDAVAFECRREWREHLRSADTGHRRAVERLGSGLRRDHQFRNIAIASNRKLNSYPALASHPRALRQHRQPVAPHRRQHLDEVRPEIDALRIAQ